MVTADYLIIGFVLAFHAELADCKADEDRDLPPRIVHEPFRNGVDPAFRSSQCLQYLGSSSYQLRLVASNVPKEVVHSVK